MESTTTNSVSLMLGYENTEQIRTYKITDVPTEALSQVEAKINAYNTNVPAKDKLIFVSDDGDHMTSIVGAKYEVVTETVIIRR